MTNEQLQQFFIQQAAAAAAAAAVFSSLWNGQQPPTNNQQVQSQQQQGGAGDDTGSNNSTSTSANVVPLLQQISSQNPLDALIANAGSSVNLAALMQNLQKQQQQQQQQQDSNPGFNMSDQQQAAALAAMLARSSSSSHILANASNNNNNNAINALPSVLQHQLDNLISPPSNNSHNNSQQQSHSSSGNNKLQQLNSTSSTSSSPSSLNNHQQPTTNTNSKSQLNAYHHYQSNANANANTRSSSNSKSISGNNNQAINNQHISHNNNNTTATSLDGDKIEVGLNMTTTALSSTPNSMQSSHAHARATSSPITNIQAPINVASQQHHKTSSSSHHHQSSHKQSLSTNSSREPISSSVLAKNNVGLPRKLVRGQDVWLGRGVEQTRQILKCMWCGQSCRTLADLSQHMKETQHYTNIVSQEQITSWRTPDNDIAQSQVNQVFTCKVCDEAFSSLNELSNHMVKKSHYNGQPMSSPIGNYGLVGESNIINQQNLLTTANSKSPPLSNPDMQSLGQKKQKSSSYNEYDNQLASPPIASNSTKERRKKSLPVRKLLELERKSSAIGGRLNQARNELSENISGSGNQDSDCEDSGKDNSSMALMSRMLDRQEMAYGDNDQLANSDDEEDNSLDQSPKGRLIRSQLSPGMSDHESMHSSTSASYKNQIHIDTSNLTTHCQDCYNQQRKSSSCRQKCKSCSNSQSSAIGSTLYKPGTVGRQLLASLMNNKLDPDQLDDDLLNKPLIYDSNGDVVINFDDRLTSAQTKTVINSDTQSKVDDNSDNLKNQSLSETASPNKLAKSDEINKREQLSEEDKCKTSTSISGIKTEKSDNNKCSQFDMINQKNSCDSSKSDTFQDIKVNKPQTLSAASLSDKSSSKTKAFGNTSSLSALEMLVEKSFDPKTRRGAQNTGILQRLGIDEEICPPWQNMNYASWYAAAAASYGGIPGNPMAAMSGLSGYPLPPGMPMSMGPLGNMNNSARSHNNMTPMSAQGASMTPPMRTPSSSPPTNMSSPHSQHLSHNNKSLKSMSINPSVANIHVDASSSPSLNSLMATTHQQLQNLTSSSMQYHQSPHSSPTASTKASTSSSAGRNNKRSFQDEDLNESPTKSASSDSKQTSRRAPSSGSRNNSSSKGSKKAKTVDESSTNCITQTSTSNRYPKRSKASTTLNKLKQQLESESEDDFEDYQNEQEPVSLAMKRSTKSATASLQQQDFQQNQLQQFQQLQLQLQHQQQQQLPREDVNQQSLAAMQATFLLKQLMTQAMASMVSGNQVQPTPDNLASVQQYLLGSMLNQNQNQTQSKPAHADNMQQSKKKSAKRSFSDDIDEDYKEGLSDDGDIAEFTSSASASAQQNKQQSKSSSSSRGRKSTKKLACKKSSASKKNAQCTSSSTLSAEVSSKQRDSNQQDTLNSEEKVPINDDKYTVASSEEQDSASKNHSSLLKQEKSKSSSRRRKQQPRKDTGDSGPDVNYEDGGDEDDDDKDNANHQMRTTGQQDADDDQDHHSNRVLNDEQGVADSNNKSSGESIIGKINADNDLNDLTAIESNREKKEEGDNLLLCNNQTSDHDASNGKNGEDNVNNIDQDKSYHHHEKSIASDIKMNVSNQNQTVVSSIDDAEKDNTLEPSETDTNKQAAHEIIAQATANEKHQTINCNEALLSQAITDTDKDLTGEINSRDRSTIDKLQSKADTASSEDNIEGLSASRQLEGKLDQSNINEINKSDSVEDCDTHEEKHSAKLDQNNLDIYSKLAVNIDNVSAVDRIASKIVDDHNNRGLGGINHDDLTSSDEDNEDDGSYLTSASIDKSPRNRHKQQQQTVLSQVGKTNGDNKSILEVKP